MYTEQININNFRNINNEIFIPSKNINILVGKNAQGKTSYIESIYLISNLKSFRTRNINEIVNHSSDSTIIDCKYKINDCNNELKLKIQNNKKVYLKNDKKINVNEYLWSLLSIIFKPGDILLIDGSPSLRRELIDKAIFYIDKDYIKILIKYKKIIANKNHILKTKNYKYLDEWNDLVVKYSKIITSKRNNYIQRINTLIDKHNYEIKSDFKIIDIDNFFYDELIKNLEKEKNYGYSVVGSHRENIDFYLEGRKLKSFGSQGQKRAFILLFKSSQILDFEKENNFSPVLLLDDMASELDKNNRNLLFDIIENFKGQTFITTVDDTLFSKSDRISWFHVEDGKISSFSL